MEVIDLYNEKYKEEELVKEYWTSIQSIEYDIATQRNDLTFYLRRTITGHLSIYINNKTDIDNIRYLFGKFGIKKYLFNAPGEHHYIYFKNIIINSYDLGYNLSDSCNLLTISFTADSLEDEISKYKDYL